MTTRKRPEATPLSPKPTAPETDVESVRYAVGVAAAHAEWLKPADDAALRLAFKLAADIDKLGPDEAGQLASLARTFLTTLDRLGMTVTSRLDSSTASTQEVDPLDQLRLRAEARLTPAPSGDTATVRSIAGR